MAENKPAGVAAIYAWLAGDGVNKPTVEQKKAYPLARFRSEWEQLSMTEKTQLASGIGDGSFTYV